MSGDWDSFNETKDAPPTKRQGSPWLLAGAIVVAAIIVAGAIVIVGRSKTPKADMIAEAEAAQVIQEAQGQSQDRAAQSALRNALVSAKTVYTDDGSYSQVDADVLSLVEPSLCFVDSPTPSGLSGFCSGDAPTVSVTMSDEAWAAATLSATGTCFWVRDVATSDGGTTYGSGFPCTGEAALDAEGDSGW